MENTTPIEVTNAQNKPKPRSLEKPNLQPQSNSSVRATNRKLKRARDCFKYKNGARLLFVLIVRDRSSGRSNGRLSGSLSCILSGLSRLKVEKIKQAVELSKYCENKPQTRSKYLKQPRARLSFFVDRCGNCEWLGLDGVNHFYLFLYVYKYAKQESSCDKTQETRRFRLVDFFEATTHTEKYRRKRWVI